MKWLKAKFAELAPLFFRGQMSRSIIWTDVQMCLACLLKDLFCRNAVPNLQADEASLKYHDQSVNENDHLAHALEIIKETQVFGTLDAEAQRIIRSVIIDMVLRVRADMKLRPKLSSIH